MGIAIQFGKAEKQTLDANSMFIQVYGHDFTENLNKIKSLDNRQYIKEDKSWEVPYCYLEEVKKLFSNCEIKYVNEPPKAIKVTNDEIIEGLDFNGYKLFDYQIDGVKYGLEHHNFLLLDEQGCGKSLQAITLARYKKKHYGLKHCLIICGVNSLKWNWQREIEKFCPDEKGVVLGTAYTKKGTIKTISAEETKKQIESCSEEFFWIINIEKMRVTSEGKKNKTDIVDYLNKQIELGNLGMVFIDETHVCKNICSSQSAGVLALDPSVSKVGMTGTILVNNPLDLYCPMKFVGLINDSMWQFKNKYVILDDFNQPIGYKNMDKLHEILYKSSIRRTKDLLDLPDKVYKQEWLEFSKEEQNLWNEIIGLSHKGYLDKIEPIQDTLAMITRMRQATVYGGVLTSRPMPSTKFDRLKDILLEAKYNGQKVLVFCPFTEALKLGVEYCKEFNPKLVAGGMGQQVQQVVDAHENTEGFSVLFAQEKTLGVGYTLKNTEIVVFLSPPWSKATYMQAIDRCHRYRTKTYSTNN